ncbi:A/G-specific adenine glycosylase [Candidatus Poribacteria bacterium]|nr:A/G-specific adenine glycosylase [Candidatus Poribacteria bacterium]
MSSQSYKEFNNKLIDWFRLYKREMPWRGITDPYRIWVSEVMLQQTQVKKVVGYYENFMKRFPDIQTLASSSVQDVLKVWEGLGYYARARNLHKAAQQVVKDCNSQISDDYNTFRKLPGIGDYSAAAVMSIAFNQPYAAVDGNIKRVLSRLFLMDNPVNDSSSSKVFQEQADLLLDRNEPGCFNQAMMELGATVCRPQSPACVVCPVNAYCKAYKEGLQNEYPFRTQTKKIPEYNIAAGIIYKDSDVLIVQRPLEGLLGGLWEFPNGNLNKGETSEEACIRHILQSTNLSISNLNYLTQVKHAYTHFKIIVHTFECEYTQGDLLLNGPIDAKWIKIAELDKYPLPKATHKIIDKLTL